MNDSNQVQVPSHEYDIPKNSGDLRDYAMSLKPIPEDMVFTKSEVRYMVNIKVTELEIVAKETTRKLIDLAKDSDFLNDSQKKYIIEYLEMVEEDSNYSSFSQI